jgi:hypothetical protein
MRLATRGVHVWGNRPVLNEEILQSVHLALRAALARRGGLIFPEQTNKALLWVPARVLQGMFIHQGFDSRQPSDIACCAPMHRRNSSGDELCCGGFSVLADRRERSPPVRH